MDKSGIHASTVEVNGRGVMFLGASGAGKTELVLTLIERAAARGENALLVADDRTLIRREGDAIIAGVPEQLAGGIEIRGAGLFRHPFKNDTKLALVVRLVQAEMADRFPEGHQWHFEGVDIPCLHLRALSTGADSLTIARAVEATLFYEPWP
ncbi:HPr kinase/phosphorylase [Paenochrobactrum sp. BZR 588]|uniref:HPr kinase/phosphorylase n=1 Tax=Paenochrobactrum TaxID=999488 RepID=UPI0035BC1809